MEYRSLELKKEIITQLKEKLNNVSLKFLLMYNSQLKENESYIRSISKVLNNLNIPHDIKAISTFEEAKDLILNSNEYTSLLLARPTLFKNENDLFDLIPLNKDCDMLSSLAIGKLTKGNLNFLPATAKAVHLLINHFNIDVQGKKVLIIGRSPSVGSPIATLMLKLDGSITIVHSKTKLEDIKKEASLSDIIVLASGKRLLDPNDIKKGSIIIDCGYNEDGQGDLGFVPNNASFTPVPGGIGPLTTISIVINALYLLENFH